MCLLFLSVPVGAGQVYGCDSPWTGGLILLSLLLCLPAICFHATFGLCCWVVDGLLWPAPQRDIYTRLWGCNSALSSSAIGGVFLWFCCLMIAATSNLMSAFALPACTWPFCLSTLISLLISSEIPAICRLPLSVVSYPEVNLCYQRQLKKAQHSQQKSGQEEAPLKEREGPSVYLAAEKKNLSLTFTFVSIYIVGMEW
ncbi:urea transporter 1-like [Haplochromis burtoni]|uniref:urea transporter 1-like n=1 Tax=Haplochromis burtoni TaxID=8153 RepID=UPI001C2D4ED8|nr:urea transporter 1-like [Haplochromis burtoni]